MTWTRNRQLGLTYRDKERSAPAFTLFSPVRGRHADLLDHEGNIVHQWRHGAGIQHLKWLPDGHLLVHTLPPEDSEGAEKIGGNAGALVELDLDSNVVWEHHDVYMHHDYQRLENGNTLIVRWEKLPADVTARVQGGHVAAGDPDWMWGDVIREIDPSGATVREWRSWEHLSTDHHVKCPLENGHVLVFDNGCHRKEAPSFSQVVEVDPATNKIEWTYKAEPILAFFSFMVSGCERLPDGNTFITEGATGRMFEVTPEGETVWEYVSPWLMPSHFGPATAVFRAYRVALDDPRLAGLPLSPAPYDALNERIAASEVLIADDEPT